MEYLIKKRKGDVEKKFLLMRKKIRRNSVRFKRLTEKKLINRSA